MRRRRAGFTLLEMMIAMTILALIAINVSIVTRTGSRAARSGAFLSSLHEELDLTLDRISLALMSADAQNIYPVVPAPGFTSEITYSISLGVEDGELVTSPPECISWEQEVDKGQVLWRQNPGLGEERSVVWSNWVPVFQEGEQFNAEDDNDNGLTDESGLAFDVDGEVVNIHLTIERQDPEGEWVAKNRKLNITCRN